MMILVTTILLLLESPLSFALSLPQSTGSQGSVRLSLSRDSNAPGLSRRSSRAGHRLAKRGVYGSVRLAKDRIDHWTAPVVLGNQTVKLTVDSGSGTLWVNSSYHSGLTENANAQKGPAAYNPYRSSTFQLQERSSFNVCYADCALGASGGIGLETVSIGEANVTMPIGVADKSYFGHWGEQVFQGNDGALGLSFKYNNHEFIWEKVYPDNAGTFMDYIKPSLNEPVFATAFSPKGGLLEFGRVDRSLYKGDISEVKIDNATAGLAGFWAKRNVTFAVDGKTVQTTPVVLIFDTGNTIMTLPPMVVDAYFAKVDGARRDGDHYWYPCKETSKLPPLEINLGSSIRGSEKMIIPGNAIYYGPNDDKNKTCTTWISDLYWIPGMANYSNAGLPVFVSKYLVFNHSAPSVLIADQATPDFVASI